MAYFARPQSNNAAVKIVIPTTEEEKVAVSPSRKKGTRQSEYLALRVLLIVMVSAQILLRGNAGTF